MTFLFSPHFDYCDNNIQILFVPNIYYIHIYEFMTCILSVGGKGVH